MPNIPEIEDLLTAIATLTDHNSALLDQLQTQNQEAAANTAASEALIRDLTQKIQDYQDREHQITAAIADRTAQAISSAVATVLNHYHHRLTQGVGGHVDNANHHLAKTVNLATHNLGKLNQLSADMTQTFNANFKSLNFFAIEFEHQNRQLANDAKTTLTHVRQTAKKNAEDYTNSLSKEFAEALSWKIAGLLGAVCFGILLFTLLLAWLLIPSKADIAERKSQYQQLAAVGVYQNIIKGSDGYYAKIKQNSCFKGTDGNHYCKFK